jgi:hypothetical protein
VKRNIAGTVTRILHDNFLEVKADDGQVYKVRSVDENEPLPIGTGKNVYKHYLNKYVERQVSVDAELSAEGYWLGKVSV